MTGAVLAGGHSRRMGADKGLLPFGDRRLVEVVVDTIRPLFSQVLIVADDTEAYGGFGVPVEPDRLPGNGPLGGIHSALCASRFAHTFCIACDMPLADPGVITYLCTLAHGHDVVVPCSPDGLEPLHAVYAHSCISHLERMIRDGRLRVDALYPSVRVRRVTVEEVRALDPSLRCFRNVNTPADLDAARRLVLRGETGCES